MALVFYLKYCRSERLHTAVTSAGEEEQHKLQLLEESEQLLSERQQELAHLHEQVCQTLIMMELAAKQYL